MASGAASSLLCHRVASSCAPTVDAFDPQSNLQAHGAVLVPRHQPLKWPASSSSLPRHSLSSQVVRNRRRPRFSMSEARAMAASEVSSSSSSGGGSSSDSGSIAGESEGLTYRSAGVDIDAGNELVKRIAKMAPGIGGFGGLFPFGDSYLVAGTDGVGTKLKLAFALDVHDTIGIDLVAMSVNDIITSGAKPLFFLDYFASSKLNVDQAEQVLRGIVRGCQLADCVLLGGETAEMPGFYAEGEYDLSGFAVGAVKKDDVINGSTIQEGDVIIGLPSSGLHSNGFSLARRVVEVSGLSLSDPLPGSNPSVTIGEAMLAPTTIYVRQVLSLLERGGVKGIAHITGGGLIENIPRVIPKGLGVQIEEGSWEEPAIFTWLRQVGKIDENEMRRTFNMGIGMVLVVSKDTVERFVASKQGKFTVIGTIVSGEGVSFV